MYYDNEYETQIITNLEYPTIGSMYTVYLGLQDRWDISEDGEVPAPAIRISVENVVVVDIKNVF